MKKEHAEHNERVCDYLLASEGKYNDWVVTTAFYSALHYVQHEIFPLDIGGVEYLNFDDYYGKNFRAARNTNKHVETINLVKVHFSLGLSNYKFLHDACMNARYKNYVVSPEYADTCRKRLTQLKAFLKK